MNAEAVEEVVEDTVDTVLSPFAKLSKGIQSLGFGKKGAAAANVSSAGAQPAAEEALEAVPAAAPIVVSEFGLQDKAPMLDEYSQKIIDSGSRTRVLIL